MYKSESWSGITSRLPMMTLLLTWPQSVICWLMIGSWSMRASIWAGPKIVVSAGNR